MQLVPWHSRTAEPGTLTGVCLQPTLGVPYAWVPSHSALCPGKVASGAGTGLGPRGLLKGTFWWQMLKKQVTERKR